MIVVRSLKTESIKMSVFTFPGFAQANQFNYGVDDAEMGNSVQLVSSFRSISCDVEKDASHSTQITCYTRYVLKYL